MSDQSAPLYADRKTFVVPVTSGNYAPEEILLCSSSTSVASVALTGVTALLETLGAATGAAVELWLLKVGGDPTSAADFFKTTKGLTAVGSDTWPLASWRGAKIRVKSGGSAGSVVVSGTAD